jgi:hypothetical protein
MLGLLAAVLLAVPAFGQGASREGPPRNIILIGWDGAQRAHVQEALARGELPTLKKLSEEGALVDIDVITGATDTKAGWTQILTGYNPEVTGTYSNGRFRDCPAGLSVFERLKAQFGSEKFAALAVIGKSSHCGEIREPFKKPLEEVEKEKTGQKATGKKPAQPGAGKQAGGKVVEENGVKYLVFEGSPYYTMHKSCDVWEYGLMLDGKVGARALEVLEQYKDKPFFFFVHFAEVDHKGHAAGENSKEYTDALISGDTWTGKIVEKLKSLGLYDKTLVYVTADHGFDEDKKSHGNAPYVFLGTNDPKVKRSGMRQDIAPTILDRFGVDLGRLQPPLDGEPLTKPAIKPVLTAPERSGKPKTPAEPKPEEKPVEEKVKKKKAA